MELIEERFRGMFDLFFYLPMRKLKLKFDDVCVQLIEERFRGMFDFFYLPIDFKNKCNVG